MSFLKLMVRFLPMEVFKQKLIAQTLTQLDVIVNDFGLPTRRYSDNIQALYDCVKDLPVSFIEDFILLKQEKIKVHTKSSQKASELVSLLGESYFSFRDFFEELPVRKEMVAINWYSNAETVDQFVTRGVEILYRYLMFRRCEDNTASMQEIAQVDQYNETEIRFYESRYFDSLVIDLIETIRIVLLSNVRS